MTPQQIVDKINNPRTSDTIFHALNKLLDQNKVSEAISYIQDSFGCDEETAKNTLLLYKEQIYDELKKIIKETVSSLSPAQIAYNNAVAGELQNVPTCPICQSTNLKKISGLSKVGSIAVWGVFAAGRTSKTWHCNHCGSEW